VDTTYRLLSSVAYRNRKYEMLIVVCIVTMLTTKLFIRKYKGVPMHFHIRLIIFWIGYIFKNKFTACLDMHSCMTIYSEIFL
jgi:hypothetical protein